MAQPPRSPANAPKQAPVPAPEEPTSRVRWLLGWVVTPILFFGGIFVGGAYLGANHPDASITRGVMWVAGLF